MPTQRGRKSAASLEVTPQKAATPAITPDKTAIISKMERPACPPQLNDEEAQVWFSVVSSMSADWFGPESHPLLIQFCRHTVQSHRVAELIERSTSDPKLPVSDYQKMLQMQAKESAMIGLLAVRLRIAQQSTTNHRGHKTKAVLGLRKPWDPR